jgi:hypothetical protein
MRFKRELAHRPCTANDPRRRIVFERGDGAHARRRDELHQPHREPPDNFNGVRIRHAFD